MSNRWYRNGFCGLALITLGAACAAPEEDVQLASDAQALNLAAPFNLWVLAGDDQGRISGNWHRIDSTGGTTGWVCDDDRHDPDALALWLTNDGPRNVGFDFRIGIRAIDGEAKWWERPGAWQWTGWASQGGGWSSMGTDEDGWDPDCYEIQLQTRPWPAGSPWTVRSVRVGLRAWDNNGRVAGPETLTPAGGGPSGWAFDPDAYDPDGFSVGLVVE